jgi:hypothetical protein
VTFSISDPPTVARRIRNTVSEEIGRELRFVPSRTTQDAIRDLVTAFKGSTIPQRSTDSRCLNVELLRMLMESRGI